ncbi:hypothetical protein [Sphingomonas sp. UYP23]
MLFAHTTYPVVPLSPIAAVFLEGFLANERCRATDHDLDEPNAPEPWLNDEDYQRACALYSGARDRARSAGPKSSHADQAAALLVLVDDLDRLLEGHFSRGAKLNLEDDEMQVLRDVRYGTAQLLRWHFENGAGALRPIAVDLGLVK